MNINIVKHVAVIFDRIFITFIDLNLPIKKHSMYFKILPPSNGYIVIMLNTKINMFIYINSLFSKKNTNMIINITLTIGPASATANFFKVNKLV